MTIGIDIGGTHTDGVFVNLEGKLLHSIKVSTTRPLELGFSECLKHLLHSIDKREVKTVVVGSTHAMNALLEGKKLAQIGLIRLAGHAPEFFPPAFDWPKELRHQIVIGCEQVNGGYECDGRALTPLNKKEIASAIASLLQKKAQGLVVQGVFSPLYPEQELEVGELIREIAPEVSLTLSHEIGGMGFLERENGALLNCALMPLMCESFHSLSQVVASLGMEAEVFLTQNQGSRLCFEEALKFPLKTLSAGPTNSFIGAAKLEGLLEAIVVDIGGTSTDVGVVKKGFPRKQLQGASIAGIPLSYQMPDVISVSLGGGTLFKASQCGYQMTQESCAHELRNKGYSFGGSSLTLTDLAIALGHVAIEGASSLRGLPCDTHEARTLLKSAYDKVEKMIQKARGPESDTPVIFVGGGASLFPREWLPENVLIPKLSGVANAYGAALAEISATFETVFSLSDKEEALSLLKEKTLIELARLGGEPNEARLVDLQVIPYHYMPGGKARGVVTCAARPKKQ